MKPSAEYLQWSGGLTPEEVKAKVSGMLADAYQRREAWQALAEQGESLLLLLREPT